MWCNVDLAHFKNERSVAHCREAKGVCTRAYIQSLTLSYPLANVHVCIIVLIGL